jgi:hypothetical protein
MPIKVKGQTADRHPRRPWNSPERRRERQKEYMDRHGEPGPRRKRLTPKKETLRDKLKKVTPKNWGSRSFYESAGGGVKAKPHSTKEGRTAAGKRRVGRILENRRPKTMEQRPLPKWKKQPKHVPAKRVAKAIGGAVKTIPRITKRFLDFIKTGKHVDKKGVKVNVPKAAERLTGKPHVDHGKRKRIKHLGKGKAEGGRIGLKKGSVHKPGSHSWYLQHMNRTKKASGGRANFRHGGSVGAAVRGHGAEIK